MSFKSFALAALFACTLAVGARAESGTIDDAWRALDQGRPAVAEAILQTLAGQGDAAAQLLLGDLYFSGDDGLARDYAGALQLYEQAAEAGALGAMTKLSFMYSNGLGTAQDAERAALWEQRLIAGGDVTGLNNLAYTYAIAGENLDEALELANEAVARAPENGFFLDTLGYVLYRMGRYAEAIPPLCRSVQLTPQQPENRLHLGDAYWRAGDPVNARYQWQRGLDLYTDSATRDNPDARAVLDSQVGAEIYATLADRLADGLPGAVAPAPPAPGGGTTATHLDECQIPTV